MKAVLIVALFACVLAVVYGDLVCGTNYCKQNPCANPVTSSSCKKNTEYRENHAGKCGCCPACVTKLPEGAACKTYSKDLGETPSAICTEPLKCLNGRCTSASPRT